MANFFTPEFDPPALPPDAGENERKWQRQVGAWLQKLSHKIDAQMEAYISTGAQMASGIVTTTQRQAMNQQSVVTTAGAVSSNIPGAGATGNVNFIGALGAYTFTHGLGTIPIVTTWGLHVTYVSTVTTTTFNHAFVNMGTSTTFTTTLNNAYW